MKFELLCIDMFQTLVNIDSRIPHIWEKILKDNYTDTLAFECARLVSTDLISAFHENTSRNTEFINLKTMFRPSFKSILEEMQISFDVDEAVKIFIEEHPNAMPYDDAERFFSLIGQRIPICLITDADYEMILPLLRKYNFDKVFISEEIMSYKNEPDSKIFKSVLEYYAIDTDRILHIGDSVADIAGANRVGIKTC